MGVNHKKFDGDWNLPAVLRPDGSIQTANTSDIQTAQLMLIRDEAREQTRLLYSILSSVDSIRHFVHALGGNKLKLLVSEEHRVRHLRKQRRLRAQAAARRRLKKGRPYGD